jgi:exopolysaccharide production protein ExoQ
MAACITIPLLCAISTLWSDYPSTTGYLGTAFFIYALCIMIIARSVTFTAFSKGMLLGLFIALGLTVLNGRYQIDPMTGSYSLFGLYGSKNMVGFAAEIGSICAAVLFFTEKKLLHKLLLAVLPLLFFVYCLSESRSGTAQITLLVALSIMLVTSLSSHIPRSIRGVFIGLGMMIIVLGVGSIFAFGGQEKILRLLGKDATLTGRTYLWEEGFKVGADRAILGHGYSAFWVQGNPAAERYWSEFYIEARAGFHFHNSVVQVFVDLGALGVLILGMIALTNLLLSMMGILRYHADGEHLFWFGIAVMFISRAWVEVDFFVGPFGTGSLLFYSIIPRLIEQPRLPPALSTPQAPIIGRNFLK